MSSNISNAKTFLVNNQSCTLKCKSKVHQALCRAALTQNVADEELVKCFLLSTCQNFWRTVDASGCSLVHWAASCGKCKILEWLLEKFNIEPNWKDVESGYTPLHRAFLHGHIVCAQILLKFGASLNALDFEGLTPIDVLHKNSNVDQFSLNDPSELYAAGENLSYNLGLSIPVPKLNHEPIELFSRQLINVKQVAASNFHSVFVCTDGRLFTCGHGAGGRLGHNDENAQVLPRLVENLPSVRCADVSNSHTLVVTVDGCAYSWGENVHKVLGHPLQFERVLAPKQVLLPKNFKGACSFVGCAASASCSALWTEDMICSFGENHGHLGHTKNDGNFILFPKQVTNLALRGVERVVCCDIATAVVGKKGDVYVLHDFEAKKVVNRMLDLKSVHIVADAENRIRMFFLTTGGKLFQWCDGDSETRRSIFTGVPKLIYPIHVSFHRSGVFLTASNGTAYSGKFLSHKPTNVSTPTCSSLSMKNLPVSPSSTTRNPQKKLTKNEDETGKGFAFRETGQFLNPSDCYQISLHKIPNVYRAMWTECSRNGQNSFILQQHSSAHLTELPTLFESQMFADYERLLHEADIEDTTHDININCGSREFPAHKFVLASRSAYFARNLSRSEEKLELTNIDPAIFEQLLLFLYTDSCEVLKNGWKGLQHVSMAKVGSRAKDPVSLVSQAAKQFGVENLVKRLEIVSWNSATSETWLESRRKIITPKFRLDFNSFPEFHDAYLLCTDNISVACHQCVLCARVDYFRCMFSSSWMGSSLQRTHKVNVDSKTARNLLHFIYYDELPIKKIQEAVADDDPLSPYCKLLVIADEWLLDRLRQMCETKLCDLISLRNVCDLLEFAQMVNADQLKRSCLQFACLNLPSLVEMNSLKYLSVDTLLPSLDRFYKQMHPFVSARTVRPHTSVSVEDLELTYVLMQSVGLSVDDVTDELLRNATEVDSLKQHKTKRKGVRKSSESSTITHEVEVNAKTKEDSPITERISLDSNDATDVASCSPKYKETVQVTSNVGKVGNVWAKSEPIPMPTLTSNSPGRISSSIADRRLKSGVSPWNMSVDASSPTENLESPVSLKDVMEMEKKNEKEIRIKNTQRSVPMPVKQLPSKTAGTVWNVSAISTSPPSQADSCLPVTTPNSKVIEHGGDSLSKIILAEEKSLFRRREVLNKPLKFIQCEELALQQLLLAYDVENNFDEFITVERHFDDNVAEPSWQAHCGSPA